jgi:hypothetical protein
MAGMSIVDNSDNAVAEVDDFWSYSYITNQLIELCEAFYGVIACAEEGVLKF